MQPAKNIKINGTIVTENGAPFDGRGNAINLVSYKMGEGYFSSTIDSVGKFGFTFGITQTVLYELKYGGLKMEVLLCPTEPEVKIQIKTDGKEVKSMKVVDSKEYEAYRQFKHLDKAYKDKLHTLLADCGGKDKDCVRKIKKETDDFNALLEYLREAHKGTFAAEVLAPMDEMPEINTWKPIVAQLREHFFDKANLFDPSVYVTPDINYNLSEYLDDIADTTAKGRMVFIDALNDKTKGDKNGQKELISLLLTNFMDGDRENYLWTLSHWASGYALLPQEQPVLDMKLKMLAKTVPGMPASEVTGTDTSNQLLKLSSIIKKNKLTLLIFWGSDCPHCRAAMPEFIKIYEQYHARGLEIFGVSLEQNKVKWKQFVTEKKLSWTNVALTEHEFSPNDYFLQFTPTLALINQDGIILHRFLSIADFSKSIGEILAK